MLYVYDIMIMGNIIFVKKRMVISIRKCIIGRNFNIFFKNK